MASFLFSVFFVCFLAHAQWRPESKSDAKP